jgi:hypothetical protein
MASVIYISDGEDNDSVVSESSLSTTTSALWDSLPDLELHMAALREDGTQPTCKPPLYDGGSSKGSFKPKAWYVVLVGRGPGIYTTWFVQFFLTKLLTLIVYLGPTLNLVSTSSRAHYMNHSVHMKRPCMLGRNTAELHMSILMGLWQARCSLHHDQPRYRVLPLLLPSLLILQGSVALMW